MKILHIGPDSQFIQFISGVFEAAAPGANRYLITSAPAKEKLQFPPHSDFVEILPRGIKGVMKIPMHVRSSTVIIVHGMSPYGVVAFLASPSHMINIWSGWGYDYYGNRGNPDHGLISMATQSLILNYPKNPRHFSIVQYISQRLFGYMKEHAAKLTNYFSAPIPSDFEVFKKRFSNFSGEYAQLNYGNVEDTFAANDFLCSGVNILVGNSATVTNNHIDVFRALAMHDLGLRKVFVPLSYGDPIYRENIIDHGRKILGKSFVPLVDFIPFEKYRSIVASCNVVIMNHHRQQALGNIGAALHQGAYVFLNNLNPAYEFFKSEGAFVHSFEDLTTKQLPLSSAPVDEVAENRAILEKHWGRDRIYANVESLLARIADNLSIDIHQAS